MLTTKTTDLQDLLHRPPPSTWQLFSSHPCAFSAKKLYSLCSPSPSPSHPTISVVCISDTHNNTHFDVPDGDVLIHAGDFTQSGTFNELQAALDWLSSLPHKHKLVVAGNHDLVLDPRHGASSSSSRGALNWHGITYLQDSSATIRVGGEGGRSLTVWGSPWTLAHGSWAFQYPRGEDVWRGTVPADTDILITHGPPKGHLDLDGRVGCEYLLEELWRTKPRLHVFGHCHEGRGTEAVAWDGLQRAYEKVLREKGGIRNLMRVVWESILAMCWPRRRADTLMVNAAVVGGLRDQLRRDAIVVEI